MSNIIGTIVATIPGTVKPEYTYKTFTGPGFYNLKAIYNSRLVISDSTYVINITQEMWDGWMDEPPSYTEYRKYEQGITKEIRKSPGFDFRAYKAKVYRRSASMMKAVSHANDMIADALSIDKPVFGRDFKIYMNDDKQPDYDDN